MWWDHKSFLSPFRPPAIFGGPVWRLVCLGSLRMWDLSIKDGKQRELVAGGRLVLVFNGGLDYIKVKCADLKCGSVNFCVGHHSG